MNPTSLNQASASVLDVEITLDLHTIQLPEGSLRGNLAKEQAHLLHMKNLSLNLAMLPIQTLHELNQGMSDELRIQEKRALLVINEVKTNN